MFTRWFSPNSPSAQQISVIQDLLNNYKNSVFPYGIFKVLNDLTIKRQGKTLVVSFSLPFPCESQHKDIIEHIKSSLTEHVEISINTQINPVYVHELTGIKNIIAVSSGKGGVGKSTTSVNLAYALQKEGAQVGLLDADVYGPSIPKMLGLEGKHPRSPDGVHLEPIVHNNIASMSTGYLADGQDAKIWRGSLASSAFEQMLKETLWGDLDYLIIDMPPGTGDIQITLAQKIAAVVSVIVTTPQDMALIDATKGIAMFEKVNVPILGLIENMSYHVCPNCDNQSSIFGSQGGKKLADEKGLKVLGELPLKAEIRELADVGQSIQTREADSELAIQYRKLAQRVTSELYYQYDSRSTR